MGLIYLETDEDLGLMTFTGQKKHLEWVGKEKSQKSAVNTEAGVQPITLETIRSQGRVTAVELGKETGKSRWSCACAGGIVRTLYRVLTKMFLQDKCIALIDR